MLNYSPADIEQAADILRAAADRVQFRGWCQGALARDSAGNVWLAPTDPTAVEWCAVGAICAESHSDVTYSIILNALDRYFPNTDHTGLNNIGFNGIVAYNNAPGRTADEVADVLRQVAKELDRTI